MTIDDIEMILTDLWRQMHQAPTITQRSQLEQEYAHYWAMRVRSRYDTWEGA
jgi:hypothetical protein